MCLHALPFLLVFSRDSTSLCSLHPALTSSLPSLPFPPSLPFLCSATVTDKFTGADLTEICQRACKFAIRESIEKAYERAKAREAAGAEAMQEEEEYDVSRRERTLFNGDL